MDTVDKIIAFETGELDDRGILELFAELGNTGMVNQLQGSYGRTFADLLRSDLIVENQPGMAFRYTPNYARLEELAEE